MMNTHVNDSDIQQYVLERSVCDSVIVEHIHNCRDCMTRAEQYAVLINGIEEQEAPVFDFNVVDLVIPQLPVTKPAKSADRWVVLLIAFVIITMAGVLIYYFKGYLKGMMAGMTPMFTYLIVTTVLILLLWLCFDMFSRYRKQMKYLNYY